MDVRNKTLFLQMADNGVTFENLADTMHIRESRAFDMIVKENLSDEKTKQIQDAIKTAASNKRNRR